MEKERTTSGTQGKTFAKVNDFLHPVVSSDSPDRRGSVVSQDPPQCDSRNLKTKRGKVGEGKERR